MPPPQRTRNCDPPTSSSPYPDARPRAMVRRGSDAPRPEHLVLTIVLTLTQPTALETTTHSAVPAAMSRNAFPTATPQMLGDDCPVPEVTVVGGESTSTAVVRSLAGIGAASLGVLIIATMAFVFWRYHRMRVSMLRRPSKSDERSSPSPTPTPVTPYVYASPGVADYGGRKIPSSWFYHDSSRPPSYSTEAPVPVLLTPIPARQKRASVISQNARRSAPTPIDLSEEFSHQGIAY